MGLAGLNHYSPTGTLGTRLHRIPVPQVPWGLARLNNSRLSGTIGTSGTPSSQPPKYRLDKQELSHLSPPVSWHWRDSVIPSPMVIQAPGTVRIRGIQLVQPPRCAGNGWTQSCQPPGILETGGTQSFQAPGSVQPPGTLGTGGISIFSCPGTLGTSETQ